MINPVRHTALAAAVLLLGCTTADVATTGTRPDPIVWPTLSRFGGEAEFQQYLRDVQRIRSETRRRYSEDAAGLYAQAEEVPCPPEDEPCEPVPPVPPPPPPPPPPPAMEAASDNVVVTASRASSPGANPAITNTQKVGVDEGDIVKQIDQYLIVLQDGRLFVLDTRPGGEAGLALVDRANVYRNPNVGHVWYDEMLVFGRRIVVTGYSYQADATEFSVFALSEDGRITREGAYYLSSNDYYDVENYATRLVNDRLIIYSPLDISNADPDGKITWPLVRRWVNENDRGEITFSSGAPLYDATTIYRPVQRTLDPVIHTVSVCPLGSVHAGDELECESTAFIGPRQRQLYVSRTHAYLWVSGGDDELYYAGAEEDPCTPESAARSDSGAESSLFQIPLSGAAPRVMLTRGIPNNQFSLDTNDREFRALLIWNAPECSYEEPSLRYFRAPLAFFSERPLTPGETHYTPVPSPKTRRFENRFTDSYVVYGGRSRYGSYPPPAGDNTASRLVAIPTARPANAFTVQAPHSIIRIERMGDDIIATGYRTDAGLSVSLLDLRATPYLASTALLRNRYESEGRSHAFNATLNRDGSGILGMPTVIRTWQSGRYWDWSSISDVSFLTRAPNGALAPAGELRAGENPVHPDYVCEVSCVDWYGNARPIFTDGRIFGLTNGELVEGALVNGQMLERRRVNMTAPPPRR